MANNYRSEAKIMANENKRGASLGGLSSAAEMLGMSLPGGGQGSDPVILEILRSRTLMEHLLASRFDFDLKKYYVGPTLHRSETLGSFIQARNADRAVTGVRRMLLVQKDLKTGLITVTVDSPSPSLSRQVNERTLAFLNDWVLKRNQTRGSIKAKYAAERRVDAERAFQEAEARFSRFLQSNRNYQQSSDPSVKLEGFRLEQEAKLNFQLLTNVRLMEEQARMDEKDNMPIINIIDPPNEPIDKAGPGRTFYVLGWMLCMAAFRWLYGRYGRKTNFGAILGLKR